MVFFHPEKSRKLNRLAFIIKIGVGCLPLFFSCEDPKDVHFLENKLPEAQLKDDNSYSIEIYDRFKLSNKNTYECLFKYDDDQELDEINVEFISGEGAWSIEDSTFYYVPDTTGDHKLTIKFTDPYLKETTCVLNLNVFWNIRPVASFTYSINGNILNVDATSSYDQDEEFGGKIKNYKFILDGNEYTVLNPIFTQNIDIDEIHTIKLQVRDNDDELSSIVTDIILPY